MVCCCTGRPVLSQEKRKQVGRHDFSSRGEQVPPALHPLEAARAGGPSGLQGEGVGLPEDQGRQYRCLDQCPGNTMRVSGALLR